MHILGDCSSQYNGNRACGVGEDRPSTSTSTEAPEGSSQACAINFLTIYSPAEFIFPESHTCGVYLGLDDELGKEEPASVLIH